MAGDDSLGETGIRVSCYWHDSDVLQLFVRGSNGSFSGSALPYVGIDALADAAASLAGFPNAPSDTREICFGGEDVVLRFSCRDKAAHAVVVVQIDSKNEPILSAPWTQAQQSVRFFAAVEASAVDRFVEQLRHLHATRSGSALLQLQT
jgi:hypothetical protein